MPAYPMGKMGNCPGPRAQGGPALAEGVIENQLKRGKKRKANVKKSKSAVADGKALLFARTQLGHHVSLLIGSDFIS